MKVEHRGGRREGAGRKRKSLSERELAKLHTEFEKMAKETGIPLGRLLAEIAYSKEWAVNTTFNGKKFQPVIPYTVRMRAMELYLTYVISKRVEHDVDVRQIGPVLLPLLIFFDLKWNPDVKPRNQSRGGRFIAFR